MTKVAQQRIVTEAFSDELFKIAAENVIGHSDWDNLTQEDLDKLAYFGEKFFKRVGKGVGKAWEGIAGGNIGKGVTTAGRGLLGTLGIQTKKMKESGKDYGLGHVVGGIGQATIGGAADVTKGVLRGAGNVIEGTGKYLSNVGGTLGEGFREGRDEQKLKMNPDGVSEETDPQITENRPDPTQQQNVVEQGEGGTSDEDASKKEDKKEEKVEVKPIETDGTNLDESGGGEDKEIKIDTSQKDKYKSESQSEEGSGDNTTQKEDLTSSLSGEGDASEGAKPPAGLEDQFKGVTDLNEDGKIDILDLTAKLKSLNTSNKPTAQK